MTSTTSPASTAPASRPRGRTPVLDRVGADAVDLARASLLEVTEPAHVGEYLGVAAEGDRVVTHSFASRDPAYVGWRWAVTLARAPRAKVATVCESVLLPAAEALLAPEWVPWNERLRPGDLGVGDLLPSAEDDDRLEPGFTATGQLDAAAGDGPDGAGLDPGAEAAVAWEVGLGRPRVISSLGRDDAVDRWYSGDRGPTAPIAESAPAQCATCGFFLLMAGAMRRVFGVCANEYSPDDGRVVSIDHGCGAHSEAAVLSSTLGAGDPVLDEIGYDVLSVRSPSSVRSPGSVDDAEDADPAEDLGHS
jgi:hypothetical protein